MTSRKFTLIKCGLLFVAALYPLYCLFFEDFFTAPIPYFYLKSENVLSVLSSIVIFAVIAWDLVALFTVSTVSTAKKLTTFIGISFILFSFVAYAWMSFEIAEGAQRIEALPTLVPSNYSSTHEIISDPEIPQIHKAQLSELWAKKIYERLGIITSVLDTEGNWVVYEPTESEAKALAENIEFSNSLKVASSSSKYLVASVMATIFISLLMTLIVRERQNITK